MGLVSNCIWRTSCHWHDATRSKLRDRRWSGREIKQVIKESVVKSQKEKDLGSMRSKITRNTLLTKMPGKVFRGLFNLKTYRGELTRARGGGTLALPSEQPVPTSEAMKEHRVCGDRGQGWAAGGELGESGPKARMERQTGVQVTRGLRSHLDVTLRVKRS